MQSLHQLLGFVRQKAHGLEVAAEHLVANWNWELLSYPFHQTKTFQNIPKPMTSTKGQNAIGQNSVGFPLLHFGAPESYGFPHLPVPPPRLARTASFSARSSGNSGSQPCEDKVAESHQRSKAMLGYRLSPEAVHQRPWRQRRDMSRSWLLCPFKDG